MTFQFREEVRPVDYWRLSMYQTYHSLIGVINIVFAAAMIALLIRFWGSVGVNMKAGLVFLSLIMPVFQPIFVWMRARSQANAMPRGVTLTFDDRGFKADWEGQQELVPWEKIKGAKHQGGMLVLYMEGGRGYLLTDHVLGKEKEKFCEFVYAHVCGTESQSQGNRRKN